MNQKARKIVRVFMSAGSPTYEPEYGWTIVDFKPSPIDSSIVFVIVEEIV